MVVAITNSMGGFPTQYWHLGVLEGWEEISAESLIENCKPKPKACPRCFMACGKLSEVQRGRHKGLKIEGPEYETIYAFGGLCMIRSLEEIIYLNDLCDNLGIDTITAGNLAAFTIEASKKGVIAEKLSYGDVDGIAELLRKIVYRDGIGDILAEGIKYASYKWDLEGIAIHVKGLEPAGYDPRVLKGMALAYATSDRGACHLRSTFYAPEMKGIIDPDQIVGKAALFVDYEERIALHDALILCRFYRDIVGWEELGKIIQGTTGMALDKKGLKEKAANIIDATRKFNLQEGITSKDDTIPDRFFDEGVGPEKKTIKREELEKMLKDYYKLRGWDENGVPKSH
jgi:aldehyde:ferredoxin oxidoreductase